MILKLVYRLMMCSTKISNISDHAFVVVLIILRSIAMDDGYGNVFFFNKTETDFWRGIITVS